MGALQIPIGTYHRSESGKEGSIVLNQATKDKVFDHTKEFLAVRLRSNKKLRNASHSNTFYLIWEKDRIKRVKLDCKVNFQKTKFESKVLAKK